MGRFADSNILDGLDDIEAPPIIKIYTKLIRRKYKRRYRYAYPKYLVPVSARYNKLMLEFLEKPLEEKISIIDETMQLTLTRRRSEASLNGNK